jgi:hypothetical protein
MRYQIQRGISTLFLVVSLLAISVAIAAAYFTFYLDARKTKQASINSFEDCAKLYPVMESYPEQCNTPDGKHFIREIQKEISIFEKKNGAWTEVTGEGYQISYPSTWKIKNDNSLTFNPQVHITNDWTYPYDISLWVDENDQQVLESELQEKIDSYQKNRDNFYKEDIILGGKPAVKLMNVGLDNYRTQSILISGNKEYNLQLLYSSSAVKSIEEGEKKYPEAEEVYNQMLKSFKVLE